MILEYHTTGSLCLSNCPNITNESNIHMRIGSAACKICDHFISNDEDKNILECGFK